MDMRGKLFPIFLKEAAANLLILQQFLQNGAVAAGKRSELEAAFRAAHTLKGTARLVKVDSIHQIGRRFEALLEKHYTAQSRPTKVEVEAMGLALAWLNQMLLALKEGRPQPTGLAADALSALELAGRYPGDTPLVELLDSAAQQRLPKLDDPFSSDPELPIDSFEEMRVAQDPFADDPDFGSAHTDSFDALLKTVASSESLENQSSEPPEHLPGETAAPAFEAALSAPEPIPFDPFADDDTFISDGEPLPPAAVPELSDRAGDMVASAEVPTAISDTLDLPGGSVLPAHDPPHDPFADDDAFDESLVSHPPLSDQEGDGQTEEPAEEPLGDSDVAAESEPVAGSTQEFVESLLLPQTETLPQHEYRCCCFELSGNSYYLPIEFMLEIADLGLLIPLPLAPSLVKGLVNLRGQVVPVIDLAVLAGSPAVAAGVRRLVVAEYRREKVAFLADGIPSLSESFTGEKLDLPSFLQQHKIRGAEL